MFHSDAKQVDGRLRRHPCIDRAGIALLLLGILSLAQPLLLQASPLGSSAEILRLDRELAELSATYHADTGCRSPAETRIDDIDQLQSLVRSQSGPGSRAVATRLLHHNQDTLLRNIGHASISEQVARLLEMNHSHLVNTILESALRQGAASTTAAVSLSLAAHQAERGRWDSVVSLLDGRIEALPVDQRDHARLLQGSALMQQGQHDAAIDAFDSVPGSSIHYPLAQLNLIITLIQQDRLQDATQALQRLTTRDTQDTDDSFYDRAHAVLGYALLRDRQHQRAREIFRHVSRNGAYTNRALLGISLAALSSGDHDGAINTLTLLRRSKSRDLVTEESYLLLPYVQEKRRQELTASGSFSDAINHYRKRINELDAMIAEPARYVSAAMAMDLLTLNIEKNELDDGKLYPDYFRNNYRLLNELARTCSSRDFSVRASELLSDYDRVRQGLFTELLQRRKTQLKSYLDQSRYGQARLYDNSVEQIHAR